MSAGRGNYEVGPDAFRAQGERERDLPWGRRTREPRPCEQGPHRMTESACAGTAVYQRLLISVLDLPEVVVYGIGLEFTLAALLRPTYVAVADDVSGGTYLFIQLSL